MGATSLPASLTCLDSLRRARDIRSRPISRRSRARGARALTGGSGSGPLVAGRLKIFCLGARGPSSCMQARRPCRLSSSVVARSLQHEPKARVRILAGARIIDFSDVSRKAPASYVARCPVTSTPTTTISTTAGGAFISPSSSSVQSLLHATIFPSSETVLRTSAELQFHCTPIAQRCIGQWPPNRHIRCKQCARPAMRMAIGRHWMRRPPRDLLSWACRLHFRSSFNCGTTIDVAELRICAKATPARNAKARQ